MKVGVKNETALKEKSEAYQIAFPNLLRGYVLEEIMQLIYTSEYRNVFWISNTKSLGIDAYREGREAALEFYYIQRPGLPADKPFAPGQPLDWKMASLIFAMVFRKERSIHVSWKGRAIQVNDSFQWNLIGEIQDMEIPIVVRLIPITWEEGLKPEEMQLRLFMYQDESVSYYHYPGDELIMTQLVEIMEKLELIPSLKTYDEMLFLLNHQVISGRRMMERLRDYADTHPKFAKKKRLEQLQGYMHYAYMRKRWIQYTNANPRCDKSWENSLELLLTFIEPLWNALCDNEVFFDDWMPELKRYLG